MNEKDTNFEETSAEAEGTVDQEAPGFEMPDCCGPMMERMMKSFGSATQYEGQGKQDSFLADLPDCCRPMMAMMMKSRGRSQSAERPNAQEQEPCFCEPG
jgi:hypothetical protein